VEVIIIGAGIGGLTLALSLQRAGIGCRVFEAVTEIKPLGVGISVLPHASRALTALGLRQELAAVAIATEESCFYNRYGQFIYKEPRGLAAGYDWPEFAIHRGELHRLLLSAVQRRSGDDVVSTGHNCVRIEQDDAGVQVYFQDSRTGQTLPPQRADVAIACDGIHSAVRRQFYPDEGAPVYAGINMWRGVTRGKPYLSGRSYLRIGTLRTGKMVIYPIRDDIDGSGLQLINWVAEIESERYAKNDWNQPGRLEDFYPIYQDWRFDWLDAAALIRDADYILEYPMVDRDPLDRWTFGRVTLLGDAAHPMYPRGSNGAAQAILDAVKLSELLQTMGVAPAALQAYEQARLGPTGEIVLTNRTQPPDYLISAVDERTGGKPFRHIDDVISQQELRELSERYKRVAGFSVDKLKG
jgi:2-polyprenyl-6-methoxyphenol hydroxylase-like FAD-dependent oxidoreductase